MLTWANQRLRMNDDDDDDDDDDCLKIKSFSSFRQVLITRIEKYTLVRLRRC